MIIWISGAYGVGKSTLAEALESKIENALIFDAEEVGNAVRESYPDCPYGFVFEDYPFWAEFCYKLLKDVHEKFGRNILVPMTMLRRESYTNIIEKLIADGIDTRFVVLEGSYQSIHDRILARGEKEGCWCMESIEMARENAHAIKEGIHITTDDRTVDELADIVLKMIKEN